MEKLEEALGRKGKPWTADAPLPGGHFPALDFDGEAAACVGKHQKLDPALVARLFRLYGQEADTLLHGIETAADLGEHFGAGLYEPEVRYLMGREWAVEADDILWRRTKLGLKISKTGQARLAEYMRDCKPNA